MKQFAIQLVLFIVFLLVRTTLTTAQPTFYADVQEVGTNTTFVDILVKDFTNIVAIQFSFNYEDAMVQFLLSTDFGLPGFGPANVGNPLF